MVDIMNGYQISLKGFMQASMAVLATMAFALAIFHAASLNFAGFPCFGIGVILSVAAALWEAS